VNDAAEIATPLQRDAESAAPSAESAPNGRIDLDAVVEAVVAAILSRRQARNPDGTFAHGNAGHAGDLLRSGQLLDGLAAAKKALVDQLKADKEYGQNAVPEPVGGVLDALAEVRLLRQSVFVQIALMPGNAVTVGGRARRLLQPYVQLVDRELRLAQAIGLEQKPTPVKDGFAIAAEYDRRGAEQQPADGENETRTEDEGR